MSNENAEETVESASSWTLPFNISIETLDMIIKAFFQAKADEKSVVITQIEKLTSLNLNTLKANTTFLVAIGVLLGEGEKRDLYKLTELGTRYAKALSERDPQAIMSINREILDNSFLKDLTGFVELHKAGGKLNFDAIFNHIKTMARLKENPKHSRGIAAPYATGVGTVIEMLVRAGVIDESLLAKPTIKRTETPKVKSTKKQDEEKSIKTDSSLEELRIGDVRISLPKGSIEAAERAKELIDLYIKGLKLTDKQTAEIE